MKKTVVLFFIVAMLCVSCGKRVLIDETHQFANDTWMRFEPEMFKVKVNNTDKGYVVTATLKYDTAILSGDVLPLLLDFYIDSTELHNFTPSIRLIDKKGVRRGTTIGQYCTVTDTLDRYRIYNQTGDYTYRIKHRTSKYELFGVISFGLKIEKF